MIRPGIALLIVFLSSTFPACPQNAVPAKKTAPSAKTSKTSEYVSSERLLQRGYLLSKELPPEERVWLLTDLIMPSAKWHPALTRPWTEEVFRMAGQLSPGYDRVVTQKNAATAMSWIDVQRALQMLNQCEAPSATDSDAEDVRDVAARSIFRKFWDANGLSGLPKIQRTADHLGDTGQYPYGAMVPVIQAVSAQSPSKGNALIGEAVTFYERGSPFQLNNEEFIDFLKKVKPLMPPATRREALEALVKALTATSGEKEDRQWRVRVYTDKGVADFHTQDAASLFDILPMIREVDPDWAERLVEQHAELAQGDAARGKTLDQERVVIYKNQNDPPSASDVAGAEQWGLETSRLDQIQQIASKDPNQALTLAMSIADPSRHAMGMAYAAAGFGNKPDEALEMLKQSQRSLASIKKNGEKLETYVAIAESAASLHDLALARESVEKGLELGEQAYEEARKEHPEWHSYEFDGMDAVQKLVEIGMKMDPPHIVGRIEAVRDHALQGYMLVSAARAIDEDKVGGWSAAFRSE